MTILGPLSGLGGVSVDPCSISESSDSSAVLGVLLGPRAKAALAGVHALEHLRVLVVVDQQVGPLALGDLADLRSGERGVEQDDLGAALGGREHRVEEAAVVAGQDGDAVARLQAPLAPGVGQRVGPLVEILVGEIAALVAQSHLVTVSDRSDGHRAGQQAEPLEGQQHLRHTVRQLRAHQAAANAQRGEIRLVTEALDQFQATAQQPLEIHFYDWVLLTTGANSMRFGVAACQHPGLIAPARV